MKRPTFLAALLVTAACGPLALAVDPTFTPNDQSEIQRAVAAWNSRTRPDHVIVFKDGDWRMLNAPTPAEPDGFVPNGYTDPKTHTVRVRPDHAPVTTYSIALHELGHVLGLGHTATGIMMARAVSDEFTPEVLAECRRVGACD